MGRGPVLSRTCALRRWHIFVGLFWGNDQSFTTRVGFEWECVLKVYPLPGCWRHIHLLRRHAKQTTSRRHQYIVNSQLGNLNALLIHTKTWGFIGAWKIFCSQHHNAVIRVKCWGYLSCRCSQGLYHTKPLPKLDTGEPQPLGFQWP